jgi:hypothetical protein
MLGKTPQWDWDDTASSQWKACRISAQGSYAEQSRMPRSTLHLAAYDINEPRRLVAALKLMIDVRVDDVRAYRLPESLWKVTLGASILPDCVMPGAGL